MKEMQKAKVEIKEREERKALTKGATGPAAEPNMTLTVSYLFVFFFISCSPPRMRFMMKLTD